MEAYIDRMELCGWRRDQAWVLLEDYINQKDFDALEEYVRREECGICG